LQVSAKDIPATNRFFFLKRANNFAFKTGRFVCDNRESQGRGEEENPNQSADEARLNPSLQNKPSLLALLSTMYANARCSPRSLALLQPRSPAPVPCLVADVPLPSTACRADRHDTEVSMPLAFHTEARHQDSSSSRTGGRPETISFAVPWKETIPIDTPTANRRGRRRMVPGVGPSILPLCPWIARCSIPNR
jgi:hypothetical protein